MKRQGSHINSINVHHSNIEQIAILAGNRRPAHDDFVARLGTSEGELNATGEAVEAHAGGPAHTPSAASRLDSLRDAARGGASFAGLADVVREWRSAMDDVRTSS